MSLFRRVCIGVLGLTVVVGAGATVLRARQDPAAVTLQDGTLAGLTAEVRALRLVIEEASKTQSQLQGISAFLAAQKDRMLQVGARLDAARRETIGINAQGKEAAQQVARTEAALAIAELPQEQRADYTNALRRWKMDVDRLKQMESDARLRETVAEQDVQAEQMRWNELVARLEQLIRR